MMVEHRDGDLFVDCAVGSQAAVKAILGVWVTIYAAIMAYCVRSIFRSMVTTRLLSSDWRNRRVSLWLISPATTPLGLYPWGSIVPTDLHQLICVLDAYELRRIIIHALKERKFSYVTASLFCVVAAVISAMSTPIANHAVIPHRVTRKIDVSGVLATNNSLPYSNYDQVPLHARALDRAGAPLEQLFDFIPNFDESSSRHWLFVDEEWNNTWQGNCSYDIHPDVDLRVLDISTPGSLDECIYQYVIPALGSVIPAWATLDLGMQNCSSIPVAQLYSANKTGALQDALIIYVFASTTNFAEPIINISFVNVLLHNIGFGNAYLMNTSFKSDVHIAECTFNNISPGVDQVRAIEQQYAHVADAITSVSFHCLNQTQITYAYLT